MIAQLLFPILFVPVCAICAGLLVGIYGLGHAYSDDDLIKQFLVALVLCGTILFGGSKTNAVRMRIDPAFRIQTELDAHPVYATVKRLDSEEIQVLDADLREHIAAGSSVADAFLQARPFLTRLGTRNLQFSSQKAHVEWGRTSVETLRILQARDPLLCYQLLATGELSRPAAAKYFSAENSKAFQQVFIDVYESAHLPRGGRNSDDKPAALRDVQIEYGGIHDAFVQKYGAHIAKQIAMGEAFPAMPNGAPRLAAGGASSESGDGGDPASTMALTCEARIAQLDAVLERPQPLASAILDTLLR
jgi:hypothetical protein